MTASPETSTLYRQLASGRNDAFVGLYQRLAPSLYLWASIRLPKALRHRLDPDDILQETWFRALAGIGSFDRNRGSFRAWLFGIASHALATELRRLNRHPHTHRDSSGPDIQELPADISSVAQQVARMDELQHLLAHIETLPAEDRQLLLFRGLEGIEHAEVGRRLGLTAEAAEMRWRRLRVRLRPFGARHGLLED